MRRLMWAGLALAMLAVAGFGVVVSTEGGLRWTFDRLAGSLPGTLSAATVEGRLIGPWHITDLRYRNGADRITLAELRLDWHPWALLTGTLNVSQLRLRGLDVHSGPATAKPGPWRPPAIWLPLQVVIDDARLDGLALTTGENPEPFRLDVLALAASQRGSTLHVERAHASGAGFMLAAHGQIITRGHYPFDLSTSWSVSAAGAPAARGHGRLHGNLIRLATEQTLLTPWNTEVKLTLDRPLAAQPRWSGTLAVNGLNPRLLDATWPSLRLSGRASGQGDFHTLQTTGELRGDDLRPGPIVASFGVRHEPGRWIVDDLVLGIPGTPARLQASGSYQNHPTRPRISARLHWSELAWPEAGLTSRRGDLNLDGTLDDYVIGIDADIHRPGLPAVAITASGQGSDRSLRLTALRLDTMEGVITAGGELSWGHEFNWRFDVTGHDLNPGSLYPDWPGKLEFAATVSGRRNRQLALDLDLTRLAGVLRGAPASGSGRLRILDDAYRLDDISLRIGSAHLDARGRIEERWDLQWQLEAPDLSVVAPGIAGNLRGRATVSGARAQPRIEAEAHGLHLLSGHHRIERMDLAMDADLGDVRDSELKLQINDALLAGRDLKSATITAVGRASRHRVDLRLRGADAALFLTLAGGLTGGHWTGEIDDGRLETAAAGTWHLNQIADLSAGADQVALAPLCLQHETGRVCLQGQWQRGRAGAASVNLTRAPLALLQPWLPPDTTLSGDVDGAVSTQLSGSGLEGRMDLRASAGEYSYGAGVRQRAVIPHAGGSVTAHLDHGRLDAQLRLALADTSEVDARLSAPLDGDSKDALRGRLRLRVNDLSILTPFLPGLEQPEGRLRADVSLGGSRARPRASGLMELAGGAIGIPRAGIRVRAVQISAGGNESGAIAITGQARSGPGQVRLDGDLRLGGDRPWSAALRVNGDRFEIAHTGEIQLLASPNLQLQLRPRELRMQGDLRIPEGSITPKDLSQAVLASDDAVIVDEGGGPAAAWAVHSRVRLILGEKVQVEAFDFDGWVTGDVTLIDEPRSPTLGAGELRVSNGRYRVYGQDLDVQRGRLIFASGPINNPGLDIRAARRIGETITAGVQVRGTLRAPQLTLFSEPAMNQTDILAYLLFGRPAEQVARNDGEVLYQAAATIGLVGGELLARHIGQQFGIQEVRIESGASEQQTSLVLGTYLSPRLYINYGIGLFEPVNTLRLRYQFNKNWQLQTESGANQGADLLYTIER